jgi:hypothetical protein
MKKASIRLIDSFNKMIIVIFLLLILSSCKVNRIISINGKVILIEKLKGIHVPNRIIIKLDTSNLKLDKDDTTTSNELIGDFRYYNMFK